MFIFKSKLRKLIMFRFKLTARMLHDILNSTSMKGHIFVTPSNDGICFSNSREEEDISAYITVPKKSLEIFSYEGDEEDVYCFMVQDILPLISRIDGNVTLEFDMPAENENTKTYLYIESECGRYKGKTVLKDFETMEEALGLNNNKLEARYQKQIAIGNETLILPRIMTKFGKNKLIEFADDYKPLVIESDDVSLTLSDEEMRQKIITLTSTTEFNARFAAAEILDGEEIDFDDEIVLNVTSSFLELAIKKHLDLINHVLLLKLDSISIPYNIVFLSKRAADENIFYTATILTLRTTNSSEY